MWLIRSIAKCMYVFHHHPPFWGLIAHAVVRIKLGDQGSRVPVVAVEGEG